MYKTHTYDDPEKKPSMYEELEENEVFTPGYDEGVFKQVGSNRRNPDDPPKGSKAVQKVKNNNSGSNKQPDINPDDFFDLFHWGEDNDNKLVKTHLVQPGDTYYSLAIKYSVTVDQLIEWNEYEENDIPIGVSLIVSDPSIIGKSKKIPGIGDDMGSEKYTYEEAKNDIGGSRALERRQDWTNKELEEDMTELGETFADGEINESMVRGVFEHFYGGTGTPYTNDLLTESVKNHPSTQRFMYKQIANKFQNLVWDHIGYKADGEFDLDLEGNPRYNEVGFLGIGSGDEDNGLKITINDVHAYEVKVNDYNEFGNMYQARILLTLYDHFGLNTSDFTEHNYATFYPGFYSWYVLQWQRGYQPFVTTIPIEFNIYGTINKK